MIDFEVFRERDVLMEKCNWEELVGLKFNRLKVLRVAGKNKHGHVLFECLCDCDNKTIVEATAVKNGVTKSCGCLQREKAGNTSLIHGMTNTRLHRIWSAMISRCENKNNNRYYTYGARGIKVCPEWRSDFVAFYNWSMANGYDDNLTIDRKDNNKDYSPENCKWSTNREQANNKRSNRIIEYKGIRKNVKQWADYFGFNYKYFHEKLKKCEWSIEKLLEIPYFKEKLS